MLKNILCSQKGAVLLLAAVVLPAMLGFGALAIDIGMLYKSKTELSAAADAAALAGAQELPKKPGQAETIAQEYASRNGKPGDQVTVTVAADNRSLEVDIKRVVPLYLANIFAKNSSLVAEKSKAQVSVAASVPWIVPFVIPKTQVFDHVHTFTMRIPDPNKPYGQYEFDYMNVGIENTDFATYIKYLKHGYQKTFKVGESVKYLGPSSGGRESVDAFFDRTLRDANSDYTKAEGGQPRVMLMPVVEAMLPRATPSGTPMKIIGFVGFFLVWVLLLLFVRLFVVCFFFFSSRRRHTR